MGTFCKLLVLDARLDSRDCSERIFQPQFSRKLKEIASRGKTATAKLVTILTRERPGRSRRRGEKCEFFIHLTVLYSLSLSLSLDKFIAFAITRWKFLAKNRSRKFPCQMSRVTCKHVHKRSI